jgi:hypothetical protein
MTFAPKNGGSSVDPGISPSEPLLSASGVKSRSGMATAPADAARMASDMTSMHAAIGNSRSTSFLLIMSMPVFQ